MIVDECSENRVIETNIFNKKGRKTGRIRLKWVFITAQEYLNKLNEPILQKNNLNDNSNHNNTNNNSNSSPSSELKSIHLSKSSVSSSYLSSSTSFSPIENNNIESPINTNTTTNTSTTAPLIKKKTILPTVVFNRLLVYDLVAHPLDLLSKSHAKVDPNSKAATIKIKLFHMNHKDVTGKPVKKGGPRIVLPAGVIYSA